jgi:glycosyltransferase involved in cell wall biosynthesis
MTTTPPILSICIPTFNRAETLHMLLGNIADIKAEQGVNLEICISNNCSTDNTIDVVEKWQKLFEITLFNQSENIGATRNLQYASTMGTGKWILLIGDDDGFNQSEFSKLLHLLKDAPAEHWHITRVTNANKRPLYFNRQDAGLYSPHSFLSKITQHGIIYIGFIGSHILPRHLASQLSALNSDNIRPWPHVALILQNLASIKIHIVDCEPTVQSAYENKLFWKSGDWVRNKMRLIDLLVNFKSADQKLEFLVNNLSKKEMRAWSLFKEFIKWRATETNDFKKHGKGEYQGRLTKLVKLSLAHHFILYSIVILEKINDQMIRLALDMVGKSKILDHYKHTSQQQEAYDGTNRKM